MPWALVWLALALIVITGLAAAAVAALAAPPAPGGTVEGRVQVCGGPYPGGCRVEAFSSCTPTTGCVTADRVAVLDSRRRHVLTIRLRHARFRVRLVPGRYVLELLVDGRRVHGRGLETVRVSVRTGHTSHIRFGVSVP